MRNKHMCVCLYVYIKDRTSRSVRLILNKFELNLSVILGKKFSTVWTEVFFKSTYLSFDLNFKIFKSRT